LKAVTFLNCNDISPESPGRRWIEETEFSFLLERAALRKETPKALPAARHAIFRF
jgi:hypothetical protein